MFLPLFNLLGPWKGYSKQHLFFDTRINKKVLKTGFGARHTVRFWKGNWTMLRKKINHGCTNKDWYRTYEAMMFRGAGKHPSKCYAKITVCKSWQNPINFGKWAEKNGFKPGLTIERKNARKQYSPGNCEWVTLSENAKRAWISSPKRIRNGKLVEKLT